MKRTNSVLDEKSLDSARALLELKTYSELYRAARRQGLTIRSSVDCLIAACAIRHNLSVLHHDRGYPVLARLSSLKQQAI